jgi:hypothetical protein
MNKNKWFYRERTKAMPRMRNVAPYDGNDIAFWFAAIYHCTPEEGRKHFEKARALSAQASKADPIKWPPFLIFDPVTREWHGVETGEKLC